MKIYELVQTEEKTKLPWKSYNLTSTVTTASTTAGAVITAYGAQPVMFLRKAVDAARERMRFLEVVFQDVMPSGWKDYSVPKRTKYLADASWETSSGEYAAGTEIAWTNIDTLNSVTFTPATYNYGIALTNDAIRKNALNLINFANEELSYKYENSIDNALRDAIFGTVLATGTPTEPTTMSNTVNGAQTIYGGDATDASNSLDAGDVITPELIKKAKRLLTSNVGYFWSGNVHTKSAVTKNPWLPEDASPFVLYVAPEGMESLMNDSQFTNAAEFGSQEPVLKGEIATYCGVKIVETTKVPAFSSGSLLRVQGATATQDVAGHICAMVKTQKCAGIVWGKKAEFKTFDWPNADQIRMKLSMAHQAKEIHPDAIVRLIVTDA